MPSANMLDSAYVQFKLDYSGTTKDDLAGGGGVTVKTQHVSAGGHIWRVRCYPRGDRRNKGKHLSLFFDLLGNSNSTKTVFEAFVMDKDGAPSPSHAKRCVVVYPPGGFRSWAGWAEFARLGNLVLRGCAITVVCGIIVFGEPAQPWSDLGNHLGRLLDCGEGSDVSFSVGGVTFHAHRAVLAARSPVFKAELFGPMAEAQMPCITLQDMEPETFRVMLRFMYTDALPGDEELCPGSSSSSAATELFQNLLVAADRYDMSILKLVCAQKLSESISVETVTTTLGCADMHNCPELKNKCLNYLMADKNFKKVVVTEGYSRLMQFFPSVIDEIKERLELEEQRRRRGVLAVQAGWTSKRMKFTSKRRD